ncbi:TolC family protein, partial [Vibrio parahaemolyticus]|nr:TolC family protein [Vibrio parahaemolyticus]
GSAGAMQPNIALGEVIVAEGAVRDEGGSKAYINASYPAYASFSLLKGLDGYLQTQAVPYHMGVVRSHDSFYTDDEEALCQYWNQKGSLGADMTLPFLQWNEMKNSQAIADLDYQSAIVSYRQVLYAAFQDVENALSAREKLKYQAARLQEQYDAASAAESIYAARYQYGSTSIMDYLNAQEDTRNAQASLLENRYN